MEHVTFEDRLKNLNAWAGHLWSTIEACLPRALAELGPPGEETASDARAASATLRDIARGLDDLIRAFDLLRESAGLPRRFDEVLTGLAIGSNESEALDPGGGARLVAISRNQFSRLAAEMHFDAGWLLGAIHGAKVCGESDHFDEHVEGLASAIEEVLISYERLQGVLGVLPACHGAYFDKLVILQEEPRRRQRRH